MLTRTAGGKVPAITGVLTPTLCVLSINSAKLLEDIYIKYNTYLTKTPYEQKVFAIMGPRNIIFKPSENIEYALQRKALSAAFFKSKLISLTNIVKEVSLSFIKTF